MIIVRVVINVSLFTMLFLLKKLKIELELERATATHC